jgi:hypothetical protein
MLPYNSLTLRRLFHCSKHDFVLVARHVSSGSALWHTKSEPEPITLLLLALFASITSVTAGAPGETESGSAGEQPDEG